MNISDPLRRELDRVVGSKVDDTALRRLADRIKSEARATDVRIRAVRGTTPDQLIVNFEVNTHEQRFDLNVAKFLYNSKEGWSGSLAALTNNFKRVIVSASGYSAMPIRSSNVFPAFARSLNART